MSEIKPLPKGVEAKITTLAHRFCETVKYGEDAHMIAFQLGARAGWQMRENGCERLKEELRLAIAKDTQPYPTRHAYENACEKRDKLKSENAALTEDNGKLKTRVAELEAENRRLESRDNVWLKREEILTAKVTELQKQLEHEKESYQVLLKATGHS